MRATQKIIVALHLAAMVGLSHAAPWVTVYNDGETGISVDMSSIRRFQLGRVASYKTWASGAETVVMKSSFDCKHHLQPILMDTGDSEIELGRNLIEIRPEDRALAALAALERTVCGWQKGETS